ncbi:MAG: DUF3152 domain-containing protein [Jiangellales bacterium]
MSQQAAAPLRLTRRGRLAITVTVTALLVATIAFVTGRDSDAVPAPAEPKASAESGSAAVADASAPSAPPRPTPVPERVVSQSGSGELTVVSGSAGSPSDDAQVVRYRVLVEDGLRVRGDAVNGREFARIVHRVLTDRRGWQSIDGVRFVRVADDTADVDVVLASPDTTDRLCEPLGTGGWLSCYNGSATVLNARRWFSGADSYGDDLVRYRRYLVSHEMGHYLGHQHVDCPAPGAPAPVMVQQTKSLYGCAKNPWPAASS